MATTPEVVNERRRRHFLMLRQAVFDSGGNEVKTLGDGIMAVLPTSTSAVSCAVAMQEAIANENRISGTQVGLRVGASSGEATRDTVDYFGPVVVEASRLCALAGGGQILVSDALRTGGAAPCSRDISGARSHGAQRLCGTHRCVRDRLGAARLAWGEAVSRVCAPLGLLTVHRRHVGVAVALRRRHGVEEGEVLLGQLDVERSHVLLEKGNVLGAGNRRHVATRRCTKASATWPGVQSLAEASSSITSTMATLSAGSRPGNAADAAEVALGEVLGERISPVRKPRPRGL